MDVASPKTTSLMMSRSDEGRSSPAADTSKQPRACHFVRGVLTEPLGEQLNSWMSAVSADDLPHLHRVVRGLDADYASCPKPADPAL